MSIPAKKLKLKIVDILKVGNFYERQFDKETVQEIKQYCKMYTDEHESGENMYQPERILGADTGFLESISENVKTELQELQKVLDKNGCSYMRFIY